MHKNYSIQATNFGLALGLTWLVLLFISALISSLNGWSDYFIYVMNSRYMGYAATLTGAVIGGAWALADGFILGFLTAWFYNKGTVADKTVTLKPFAIAFALGLTWVIIIVVTALGNAQLGWSLAFIDVMSSRYIGYSATLSGALWGSLYGFIDAFVAGLLLASFYNLFNSSKVD